MIQTCLQPQIDKTAEVYVDDVVVKTRHADTLIDDLRETLKNIRAYSIKLSPEKLVFGVTSGKLLGFIVSQRGIKQSPIRSKQLQGSRSLKSLGISSFSPAVSPP